MAKLASDRVKTWRNPHLGETLCLSADFRKQRFDRHFHEEFAIGVIDSGCQAFAYDHGRRMDMPGGAVALISPGVVHTGWPGGTEGWRYRMLYPAEALVREAVHDVFGADRAASFHSPVAEDPGLYADIAALHRACADPDAPGIEIESHFLGVVRAAFVRHAGHRAPLPTHANTGKMRSVRDVLEEHYAEAVTLADLSDIVGIDRFRLLRQFKSAYGLPPHAFLLQIRIRRAHEHILAGTGLAEAALAAGFADQAHMTRAFRRTMGYTPGVLARARS